MVSQTLKKNEKLRKTSDFKRVYRGGKFYKSNLLAMAMLPNGFKLNRAGFSIEKRKARLSCQRNRIRRILREAYRQNKHRINKGFDIVFIAKTADKKISLQAVEEEMLGLFKKASIIQ